MVIESERPRQERRADTDSAAGTRCTGSSGVRATRRSQPSKGHLLSQGEETESNEANLRTDHQIRAIERSADSVARSAGHDFASKFVSVKGHVWPQ